MDFRGPVAYRLIPGRRDFTKAPDWKPREPRRRATFDRVLGRIVERIEEEALDVAWSNPTNAR